MFVDAPGNDDFTNLLLHFDAPNASTSLKDFSAQNHSATCVGTAAVSTAQSVFGGSSISLGGGGNYITIPDSNDWDFGAADFTFDFRSRHTTIPSGGSPLSIDTVFLFSEEIGPPSNRFICGLDADGSIFFSATSAGVSVGLYQSADLGLSINTWYHWAFVRNGANFLIFRDGVSITLAVGTAIGTMPNIAGALIIGAQNPALIGPAFMDEVRISKGTARWTSNFTPSPCSYG